MPADAMRMLQRPAGPRSQEECSAYRGGDQAHGSAQQIISRHSRHSAQCGRRRTPCSGRQRGPTVAAARAGQQQQHGVLTMLMEECGASAAVMATLFSAWLKASRRRATAAASRTSPEDSGPSCCAMTEMAPAAGLRDSMRDQTSAIPLLVQLLEPGTVTVVQKSAASALCVITDNSETPVTIAAAGAALLVQLLKPGSPADV